MAWGIVILIVVVLGAAVGWIPGAVAYSRRHRNAGAIMACGLCGMFFFPAWVAALVWALTNDVEAPRSRVSSRASGRRGRRRRVSHQVSDAADALADLADESS